MMESIDAEWLDVAAVNALLAVGNRWRHGGLTSIDATRIGAGFGFSGRVYRLHLGSESDGPTSVVAKLEDAGAIRRAVAFRDANEVLMAGHVPAWYGERVDEERDRGLILLEDVYPAVQGDDVIGCTETQAATIVRLIAILHAGTWMSGHDRPPDRTASWAQRDWESDRWNDRLTRAASRFPDGFDRELAARLSEFPVEAADAFDRLQKGPRAWVHRDPHPDNALWRLDGRLVMLDWSNAMFAPPAIDVAVLLSSLSFRQAPPLSAEDVLTSYCSALSANGLDVDEHELRYDAAAAVRLWIRGAIGWAGTTPVRNGPTRLLELQAQTPTRAKSALRWLDQ